MNIKEAKNEIKHTVQAYLNKDNLGDYRIPPLRQRPILLIGPPGRLPESVRSLWFPIILLIIPDRVRLDCRLSGKPRMEERHIPSPNTR